MAYNLFIAYDLMEPGQNYDAVKDRIKALGTWWQFQYSLFYIHTESDPHQAFAFVVQACDTNDRLCVINASGGVVSSWDRPPIDVINSVWFAP